MNGLYISLDGADGVGKTTLVKMLADALREKKQKVTTTRQPGDSNSNISMKIRDLVLDPCNEMKPFTNEVLFLADMVENLSSIVSPALGKGDTVITDRGLLTHYAYAHAKEVSYVALENAYIAFSNIIGCIPDITFIIIRPIEDHLKTFHEKSQSQTPDRMEREGFGFQKKVIDYFDTLIRLRANQKSIYLGEWLYTKEIIPIENFSLDQALKDMLNILNEHFNL